MRAILKKDKKTVVPMLGDKFEAHGKDYIVAGVNKYWVFAVPFHDATFEPIDRHAGNDSYKGTLTASRFKIEDYEWLE